VQVIDVRVDHVHGKIRGRITQPEGWITLLELKTPAPFARVAALEPMDLFEERDGYTLTGQPVEERSFRVERDGPSVVDRAKAHTATLPGCRGFSLAKTPNADCVSVRFFAEWDAPLRNAEWKSYYQFSGVRAEPQQPPQVVAVTHIIEGPGLDALSLEQQQNLTTAIARKLAERAGVPNENVQDLYGQSCLVTLRLLQGGVVAEGRVHVSQGSVVSVRSIRDAFAGGRACDALLDATKTVSTTVQSVKFVNTEMLPGTPKEWLENAPRPSAAIAAPTFSPARLSIDPSRQEARQEPSGPVSVGVSDPRLPALEPSRAPDNINGIVLIEGEFAVIKHRFNDAFRQGSVSPDKAILCEVEGNAARLEKQLRELPADPDSAKAAYLEHRKRELQAELEGFFNTIDGMLSRTA